MNTTVASIPFKKKVFLYVLYFLLWSVIFLLTDLYDPIKHFFAGDSMTWSEAATYIHFLKKLPMVVVFSMVMLQSTIKKNAATLTTAKV